MKESKDLGWHRPTEDTKPVDVTEILGNILKEIGV